MSDDESKAREALEAGRLDEAQAYATLHQASVLQGIHQRLYTLLMISKRTMMAAESGTPDGIILIHPSHNEAESDDIWEGLLRNRGSGPSCITGDKDTVLAWAQSRPADVRLIQDPKTGEWSQWPPIDAKTRK